MIGYVFLPPAPLTHMHLFRYSMKKNGMETILSRYFDFDAMHKSYRQIFPPIKSRIMCFYCICPLDLHDIAFISSLHGLSAEFRSRHKNKVAAAGSKATITLMC